MNPVAGSSLLEVHGLAKRFGRVVVLEDVSLSVAAGETLGVIGPNGAGKSTMLNVISGVLRPDAGRIELAGADLTHVSPARRCRAGIGRAYQIPRPFADMTVFENALVSASFGAGRRGQAARALALESLERTHLLRYANTAAGELRLLDRKRLELARALACAPRVVLLDEVAGGLAEPEVPELIDTVRAVQREQVAVVWIEHVVHALLAVAHRLICLANGGVLAIGEPSQVMADPAVRHIYLGVEPELTVAEHANDQCEPGGAPEPDREPRGVPEPGGAPEPDREPRGVREPDTPGSRR